MIHNKKIVIAVCGVGFVFIIVLLLYLFFFNSDVAKINRKLKLAQRILMEEDYEQAIDAFEAVIEIDPKNKEAYIGLAQAYVEMDDLEKAVKLLERMAKRGDSEEIQRLLDIYIAELEQRKTPQEVDIEASNVSPQSEPVETIAAESNPLSEEAAVVYRGFLPQDGELYYYDELGSIVVGWFEVGGSRYYAGTDGRLYRDGEYKIDNVKYLFDANAICLKEIKDEAWKQAYIDYIQHEYKYWVEQGCQDECEYWLINIDNNAIPELLLSLPIGGGYYIVSYFNGILEQEWGEFTYIERGNLFCVDHTAYDEFSYCSDTVYSLVEGKMTLIAEGLYMLYNEEYLWNGEQVTKEEYDIRLRKVYDYSKAIDVDYENYDTYGQILDRIANY